MLNVGDWFKTSMKVNILLNGDHTSIMLTLVFRHQYIFRSIKNDPNKDISQESFVLKFYIAECWLLFIYLVIMSESE
jgi:uncharacterized protein with PQ loop repeat